MARYAISQEGLDSLDKLSAELMQVVSGIDDACKTLYCKVEGLESGLGVYEKDILLCLREVIAANKQGKDGVAHGISRSTVSTRSCSNVSCSNFGCDNSICDSSSPS